MSPIDDNANDVPTSPDRPIKRAAVVYGKRSAFHPSPVVPADERSELERSQPSTVPAQQLTAPIPIFASDNGYLSDSPDMVDPFQFGFRHRLKELDKQFGDRDAQSSNLSSNNNAVCVELTQAKDLQSVSMGTVPHSSEERRSSGDISRASSPYSGATPLQEPPTSSPIRRYRRRVPKFIPSDSEAEEPGRSSPISPIRHAITTPHSHSSPTPPTSGEIPVMDRKKKGKASVRDVLPLFDIEQPSPAEILTKSKKGKSESLARSKMKAPTKKDRREAAFESSRIAAGRPVEVLRTQEQKHSLAAFLSNFRRDNTTGTELPSDPIERFSSPTDKSTQVRPLNSALEIPVVLKSSADLGVVNQSEIMKALSPAPADSDEDIPSVSSIIQYKSGKQQRLQAMKQVALQHADTKITDDDNEDDGLLIIKDDMHSVVREEAAQRRLDKTHRSPAKNRASLRGINCSTARPDTVSPRKFSKQELGELAKPSFARSGKGVKGQLSKKQLDLLMIKQHTEEQIKSIKRHEEEWVRKGGKLTRDTGDDSTQASLLEKLGAYAEQGLHSVENVIGDETSADESDKDYTPSQKSSTELVEENDVSSDNMEVSECLSPSGNVDEEEVVTLRRNKHGRRPHGVVGSDDEVQPVQHNPPGVKRNSASSMESQTEDENDKENSVKLMYDRSEDKENKAVWNLAPAAVREFDTSPKGDIRSPLKDISKDEDDIFLFHQPNSPCADRPRGAISSRTTASAFTLPSSPGLRSEYNDPIDRPSLPSKNGGPSELSFIERLQCQIGPEPSLASFEPLPIGGFTQLFSTEDENSKKSVDQSEFSLTLDVGLKPALEVSGTLRQKAEVIFEKEQEYVIAAAVVKQSTRPKEPLYVNDYGFLTQTRPEDSSPQIYRLTPSQTSRVVEMPASVTQTQLLSDRPPLRTLSFTVSPDSSPKQQPLRRLRRRSSSPLEVKTVEQNSNQIVKLNAYSILGKSLRPLSKAQHGEPKKSEFVAVEAEESDEDDMPGFGAKKDDNEEEDHEDEDKVVEGLVDDAFMDVETEAMDLVQEKHREHEEEDDKRLQKLHQDAIEGKFRTKRRDRGVGFEDDSDEDDDDGEGRIRQRIHKKRKIDGDNLEALGQNAETRAFYDTYHQDLIDKDDEFGYLRVDTLTPVGDIDCQDEEPEEQETVSVDEIRKRVREIAQTDYEVGVLDPDDISWVDKSMIIEAGDMVPVKVVEHQRSKPMVRHTTAGQMDFTLERPARLAESEQERKQMTSWAKDQSHRCQGTGRSGNAAAVTGHGKAKIGGGSLRSTRSLPPAVEGTGRKTRTSTLLSRVSSRSDRFT